MQVTKDKLISFRNQKLAILVDDLGDGRSVFVSPAETLTENTLNYILSATGGIPLVSISEARASQFHLKPMVRINESSEHLSPTIAAQYTSVEAREGVTTGISVSDRVKTIRALGASCPHRRALVQPGHIFPVRTKTGGSLTRACIPEAALDLVNAASFSDAALFVDILDRNGNMLRQNYQDIDTGISTPPTFSVSEIVQYRLAHESLVQRKSTTRLPTTHGGILDAILYRSTLDNAEHLALVKGSSFRDKIVTVRVQVEDSFEDLFGGPSNSRELIRESLMRIASHDLGIFIYLRKESTMRSNKSSTMREYGLGAQILRDLGAQNITLLSNTHRTLSGLDNFGISVVGYEDVLNRANK
jgi:3,4-dihydroxy 2-butanone 4-phosphate synthase/GTP cyclohydrolase II